MHFISVKVLASKLGKNPETIKRWIRNGKFPNAKKESDKNGWLIPLSDLEASRCISGSIPPDINRGIINDNAAELDELVTLAYTAVTLSHPTPEIVELLSSAGIKRTLQVLLTMQQSPTKVKHPIGFIKKALQLGWTPETIAVKIQRKKNKRIYELTQQDFHQDSSSTNQKINSTLFYNWLEE
ncbi:Helix-turn-helix domain protein [Bacillus paranthracis]|uniref:helix-turn-helix transcriptional regulator n=1 Tax=Bacillus cereus group TaxID=86661 RepID=UPI000A300F06|nr:helix-turn-helix domain-containing protein [Bacillus paranthracis]MCR6791551.1 helix-turn-helix domain-containing protein [Bacillus paranthracis]MED1169542.1 helix-turn-helix domain-containing protein [Bacillus paranthracis]SME26474.1 Helix-turn-helix domain protein [Bacillus paranthracis]